MLCPVCSTPLDFDRKHNFECSQCGLTDHVENINQYDDQGDDWNVCQRQNQSKKRTS